MTMPAQDTTALIRSLYGLTNSHQSDPHCITKDLTQK